MIESVSSSICRQDPAGIPTLVFANKQAPCPRISRLGTVCGKMWKGTIPFINPFFLTCQDLSFSDLGVLIDTSKLANQH